jgi:IQ and AAA domain-containing protein
MSNI